MGGQVCWLILGRRPDGIRAWWALPFHSAIQSVGASVGAELFLCPLFNSCRGLLGFLDAGGEQLRGWWLPFDYHLGVVSLDNDADRGWERVGRRAVVARTLAGVIGLGIRMGFTAFHCRDLFDGGAQV